MKKIMDAFFISLSKYIYQNIFIKNIFIKNIFI